MWQTILNACISVLGVVLKIIPPDQVRIAAQQENKPVQDERVNKKVVRLKAGELRIMRHLHNLPANKLINDEDWADYMSGKISTADILKKYP